MIFTSKEVSQISVAQRVKFDERVSYSDFSNKNSRGISRRAFTNQRQAPPWPGVVWRAPCAKKI